MASIDDPWLLLRVLNARLVPPRAVETEEEDDTAASIVLIYLRRHESLDGYLVERR